MAKSRCDGEIWRGSDRNSVKALQISLLALRKSSKFTSYIFSPWTLYLFKDRLSIGSDHAYKRICKSHDNLSCKHRTLQMTHTSKASNSMCVWFINFQKISSGIAQFRNCLWNIMPFTQNAWRYHRTATDLKAEVLSLICKYNSSRRDSCCCSFMDHPGTLLLPTLANYVLFCYQVTSIILLWFILSK